MSEVFDFERFSKYFVYDLKQMWRNNFKVALILGLLPLLLYIVWVIASLSFTRKWDAPGEEFRFFAFCMATFAMILYQARTYGFLTDKSRGSAWLMIPASQTEKFVSMMITTLVIIPILFAGVYFLLDGLLSLADPKYGLSLASVIASNLSSVIHVDNDPVIVFPRGLMWATVIIGSFQSLVYFLLSGLIFKKWKILGGLLVSYGLSLVVTIIAGFIISQEKVQQSLMQYFGQLEGDAAGEVLTKILTPSLILSCIFLIALMVGVYYRIKTIKH